MGHGSGAPPPLLAVAAVHSLAVAMYSPWHPHALRRGPASGGPLRTGWTQSNWHLLGDGSFRVSIDTKCEAYKSGGVRTETSVL